MNWCTLFPESWFKGFSRELVDISACCEEHDNTCSTRRFYLCLKEKIGRFHATYVAMGGSIGCWVKYPKWMIEYTKIKGETMEVVQSKCSHCGNKNNECVEFKLLKIFKYRVCQTCVSKAFRSFTKGK